MARVSARIWVGQGRREAVEVLVVRRLRPAHVGVRAIVDARVEARNQRVEHARHPRRAREDVRQRHIFVAEFGHEDGLEVVLDAGQRRTSPL